jgi:pyruvate dehydrogenase E2 component (dihydrolipoamide acetyltransferase)
LNKRKNSVQKVVVVPDIGTEEAVDIIEICVKQGESISIEQTLMVVESEKASMEIPSPFEGVVGDVFVLSGGQVKQGDQLLSISIKANDQDDDVEMPPESNDSKPLDQNTKSFELRVPDIGTQEPVDVIECSVSVGDHVEIEQSIMTVESDKASMEIPSEKSGRVTAVHAQVGQQVSMGDVIIELDVESDDNAHQDPSSANEVTAAVETNAVRPSPAVKNEVLPLRSTGVEASKPSQHVYAGPAVLLMARELGVDLALVTPTGPKARILKEDLQHYVKQTVKLSSQNMSSPVVKMPEIDFSEFGEVHLEPMTKLHKLTASNMQRNWINIPHVTQFDELDVNDLEEFRAEQKSEAQRRGVKLTPLAFIFKALATALKNTPKFNTSLHADGEHLVYKHYVNIGLAVDTPHGLVVPVVRDVDQKTIWEIAKEIEVMAEKARDKKLKPNDMKGACFTVSSLGNQGGKGFTPIINAPEVGILGVSRMSIQPVWDQDKEIFEPHKVLPVSLSYDHRVVNGGDAGRFLSLFSQLMCDLRQLALLG